MKADKVPGSSSSSEGVTCSHAAMASLQRSRKGQPVVVWRVEPGRPGTTCRRSTLRSRRGRELTRAAAYGWAGASNSSAADCAAMGRPAYVTTTWSQITKASARSSVMNNSDKPW